MARKLPRLERVLDAPALFSIAYGEIASSIYFALGVIALYALGFTPARAARRRRLLRDRRALVRRGHDVDPRDRRRRDLRPEGVQRPRRLRHRLGALPRLRDRDRAVDAVRPALPRRRVRARRRCARARGTRRRGARDRGDRGVPARCAAPACTAPWSRSPSSTSRTQVLLVGLGFALDLLAGRARGRARSSASRRRGTRSPSRCRSRSSPTPASRRSRTSPRRRGGRAARCRGASSPRSGSTVAIYTCDRRSSRSPPSRPRATRTRSAATGCARRSWGSWRCSTAELPSVLGDVLRVYVGLTGVLILLDGGDDLDLRLRPARVLARRARPAAARRSGACTGARSSRRRRSSRPAPCRRSRSSRSTCCATTRW